MPLKRVPNGGAGDLEAAIHELEAAGFEVGEWSDYGNEWLVYYRPPRSKPGPKPQVRG